MRRLTSCLILLLIVASAQSASADGWGNLKGTFALKGKAPTPSKMKITKDQEYCGKFNLMEDRLVVNQENNGIANIAAFMFIDSRNRSAPKPEIHESYKANAPKVLVDNTQCRFEPKMTLYWVDGKNEITIGNKDTIGHNTKADTFANQPFNLNIPAKGQVTERFDKPERLPVKVSCSVHPWMTGFLVVKDNPYMAATDKDGGFEIKNIPAGKWTFQFWHEAGYVDEVYVNGKKTKWSRGRLEVEIKDGETLDLGKIEVDPKAVK